MDSVRIVICSHRIPWSFPLDMPRKPATGFMVEVVTLGRQRSKDTRTKHGKEIEEALFLRCSSCPDVLDERIECVCSFGRGIGLGTQRFFQHLDLLKQNPGQAKTYAPKKLSELKEPMFENLATVLGQMQTDEFKAKISKSGWQNSMVLISSAAS